ncbi:filamentous hemagglutinin family N-terminal domain-containing protein, partial [Pseudomonas cuatrocienegasensis]
MNRTYALVWNPSLAAWTVTDERARRRAKGAGAVLAAALLLPLTAIAADLPSGGQVVSGSGAINQPNANQMVIDQASNKLAIDWQSFDIAAGNKVTFNQPGRDAIALNRVLGADGSKIMGQLDANGRVFLINPNGVLFGSGAQVNVGGLVASTLNISNSDFAAGNYKFKGNGSNASVINNGQITAADGGSVALLGGTVSNNGVIVANQGSVALAAGNAVTLDFAGDGLLNVQVDEAVVDALVENHQLIKADGGQVLLTANAGDALLKTVVNNTGVIEAQTLGEKDGKIVLLGSFDGGTVQVAGTLDASAPNGGDGGFIETSGAHVKVADSTKVTTKAANGKTGTWLIDPTDFTVSAGNDNQSSSGIGANTLSSNLASNSVTLQTVATGSEAGDINVNAAVTWNADTTLTLNAHNNININAAITASDAQGKVALQYGQASANGGTADYHIAAPINLQSGENFSTQKGSTGSVHSYTVVNDAAALQAMNNHLGGNYAVGSHIDLSGISNWQPVGSVTFFTGRFDGLGHTLSNLTIDRSGVLDPVGLFGYTSSSVIRDIGLVGGSVTGGTYVGGLVGYNLVGYNQIGAISNAYATGSVSGVDYVGGLVGYNYGGAISNAYATGSVSGSGDYVGGLVGVNTNSGTISNAYATGSVLGASQVGGLVGSNDGSISSSFYATTNAAGNPINNNGDTVAGFDGNAYGTGKTWAELTQASTFTGWSIATTGGSNAIWRIYDGYSGPLLRSFLKSVTVTVNDVAGKTYDSNTGWVAGASYSSSDNSANLLGSASYTNVATRNAGTYALGLTGLYSNQEGYDITVAAGSYTIAKATISAVTDISASNKTYDATTAANLSYDDAGFTGRIDGDALTVASASGAFTDKNAGTGKAVDITGIVLGGADAANYTLTSNTATTTADISKADLAVSGISAANKTYDASTATTLTGTASINALGSDVVFVSGTSVGAFADKNAGNDKAITVTGYTLSGTDANNYNLLQPSGVTATINKADLALSGSKVYDGSTSVAGSTLTATGVAGETFAVAGSGDASNLASKNV